MSYIKKEPLCAWLSNMCVSENIIKAIESDSKFPPADVAEVVRCKDCKHAIFYSCKNDACYQSIICEYRIGIGDENFFCACGERR